MCIISYLDSIGYMHPNHLPLPANLPVLPRFLGRNILAQQSPLSTTGFGHWCTVSGITKTAMSLTPNIFDMARIERLLVSMNAKLGTVESILIHSDDENR